MAAKNNRTIVGILLLIFLFFIMLMVFSFYTINLISDQGVRGARSSSGQIAVIEVNGVIMESAPTIELLHQAEKDDKVKAIILRINSPGGAVGPTQEIYEEVRRIDSAFSEKSDKGESSNPYTQAKPIYASFGSVAASGGYYLGSATRKIFSNPGTVTGSIGVVMQFVDLSELFHLAKIDHKHIKSGRFKDIGSPTRPMRNEEEDLLTEVVEVVHRQFVNDILATRSDLLKSDIETLAQGQIFSGEEAYRFGLVDELAGLWEAGRRIHQELELEGEFDLRFIRKRKRANIFDLLDTLDSAATIFRQYLNAKNIPALMYMP